MRRPSNNEQRFRKFITRGFAPFLGVSQEHVESACHRVLERLQGEPEGVLEDVAGDSDHGRPARSRFRPVLALSAVAAVVILMVFLLRPQSNVYAVVENADGGLYRVAGGGAVRSGEGIEANETVRTDGGLGAVLKLTDGSTIEMRSKSQLTLEDAADGVRIRLGNGSVIVNAVKRRTGHLYVQTKHMTVAVVGTVFFVNAEEEGSRVAVIEGEVRVKQGTTEQKLLPGEQVTTSPKMAPLQVKEEIAWSRKAEAHMALLEQARPQPSPEVQPKPQTPPAGTGSISGRILGMNGEPAVNTRVGAVLVSENSAPFAGTSLVSLTPTDAEGRYRLENVPAGRYYIAVGRVEYPTYYPGVGAVKDAEVVTVRDGDRLDGFDFKMVLPSVLKVSGRVNIETSGPTRSLVRLVSPGWMLGGQTGPDGSFEFNDVAPGDYDLQLMTPSNSGLPSSIRIRITVVDRDITGLQIGTPPATVR